MTEPQRCFWVGADPLYRAYHDREWGVPVRDSRMLWENLMLEGFQAGLAWIVILRKREGFRAAFAGFDPDKVARFGEADVERLMADPGIVRARAKIAATIAGARIFCDMRVTVHAKTPLSETISKDLKSRGFKFVGPTIVYAWLQAVGIVDDHLDGCFRRGAGA
jgi:DNA-3-methyladenine glycosylase I